MISTLLDALSMPGDYTRGLLAGRPGERVGGAELLDNYGANIENPLLRGLADFGVNLATDPLTYVLPTAAGAATKAAKNFLKPGVAKLLPLRRQITAIKDVKPMAAIPEGWVGGMADDAMWAGRPVGNIPKSGMEYAKRMGQLDNKVAGFGKMDAGGLYDWDTASAMVKSPEAIQFQGGLNPRDLVRHEVTHGLGKLPDAPGVLGLPQKLYNSENGFVRGLGYLADESLARHAQRNRIGDVINLFARPKPAYGEGLREIGSPLLASMYMNGPRLAMGAGLGAGALGGIGMAAMGRE